MWTLRARRPESGQALVETALVMPLFVMIVTGIIVFGLALFYQEQVNTAAREAARYAAIHSATSECPTSSWKEINPGMVPAGMPVSSDCDPPEDGWPKMTAYARQLTFGLDPDQLYVAACWSGYVDYQTDAHDAGPAAGDGTDNVWRECSIDGINPLTETSQLSCPAPDTEPGDDTASNLATSTGGTANRVSVYTCYTWSPPLAGFLLIPESVTFRAAIAEALHHQR